MIIPEELKTVFWVSAASLTLTWIYSIYMAYVNWKQAKVQDLVKESNQLLLQILEEVRK